MDVYVIDTFCYHTFGGVNISKTTQTITLVLSKCLGSTDLCLLSDLYIYLHTLSMDDLVNNLPLLTASLSTDILTAVHQ